jgi:hypothetical protein
MFTNQVTPFDARYQQDDASRMASDLSIFGLADLLGFSAVQLMGGLTRKPEVK